MEKNNKLIADFMGWEQDTNQGEGEKLYFQPHDTKWQQMRPSEMLFNTSWDWLMPVIQKCRIDSRCEHNEDENWDSIYYSLEECDINVTYKAVVDFIKNQNN